jgi:hypothetical protein
MLISIYNVEYIETNRNLNPTKLKKRRVDGNETLAAHR